MNRERRSSLAIGLLLVLLGVWFLAVQLVPGLSRWMELTFSWPLFVIGAGLLLLVIGLLTGAVGMAVPASIVTGIGLLLYYQNSTGNWESWAYSWTLIPGFVGFGILLNGILEGRPGPGLRDGLNLMVVSLILFAIFYSFLGGGRFLGAYWPVLLILLGIWLLVRPLLGKTR